MAIFTVPTTANPFYTQTSNFDGVSYSLEFRYNQREDCWYLNIGDDVKNDIVNGIKIVCNVPLLHRFSDTRLPPGELVASCATPNDSPPGLNDLGSGLRVELKYISVSELTKPR